MSFEPVVALYRSHSKQNKSYPTATIVFNTKASFLMMGWSYVSVNYMAKTNAIIVSKSDKISGKSISHGKTLGRFDSRIHAHSIIPPSWPTRQRFAVYQWGKDAIALVPSSSTTIEVLESFHASS